MKKMPKESRIIKPCDMNFLNIPAEGYISTYTRTDVTNALHGSASFRTDNQIVPKMRMRNMVSISKIPTKKEK